jgi:hypothetical protein
MSDPFHEWIGARRVDLLEMNFALKGLESPRNRRAQ